MKQKKHIVIDARLYGPKHTGLGRYTKNLLIALKDLPEFNKFNFTLLVYPELLNEIPTLFSKRTIIFTLFYQTIKTGFNPFYSFR